jgi:hypothetical protein
MFELPVADGDSGNTECLGWWASWWGRAWELKNVNCLLGLVDSNVRMVRVRRAVWNKVRTFHEEVRNPLVTAPKFAGG